MFKKITSAYEVLSNQKETETFKDNSDKWRNKQDTTDEKYYNYKSGGSSGYSSGFSTKADSTGNTYHQSDYYHNHQTNFRYKYTYNKTNSNYYNQKYQWNQTKTGSEDYKYEEKYSYTNENVKPAKFIIFRDLRTGNYFRIRINKEDGQSETPRWRKEPIDDHLYQKHYYDNDIRIEFRHLFVCIFIFATTIYFYIKLNRMNNYLKDSNAIIYKNAIYYPKNRDPIIEDMVKNKGYTFPEDIYSIKRTNKIQYYKD
jgi:hypothetical protein